MLVPVVLTRSFMGSTSMVEVAVDIEALASEAEASHRPT